MMHFYVVNMKRLFICLSVLVLVGIQLAQGKQSPRNIILMISDGWGYNQILATNYFSAGKSPAQAYELFPVVLPLTHYSANGHGYDGKIAQADATYVKQRPTDSAASGTAFATGKKTFDAAIGVGTDSLPLPNISQYAHSLGKSTGVITSVQISHATPAAFLAHNINRRNYAAIAQDMLLKSPASVIIGAGHPHHDDNAKPVSPENYDYQYVGGNSLWKAVKSGNVKGKLPTTWTLVENASTFDSIAKGLAPVPTRLLGIAKSRSSLQFSRMGDLDKEEVGQTPLNTGIPNLATLSLAGLRVLSQNSKGFFVMIEGGAVDWAGHGNRSARLIEEQMDFNIAVDSVISWIGKNGGFAENLLIVTGDHETGYLTGPGTVLDQGQAGIRPVKSRGRGKMPEMQWNSTNHTNQLVPLFAKGTGSAFISSAITGKDPVLGKYTDNAAVGRALFNIWAP